MFVTLLDCFLRLAVMLLFLLGLALHSWANLRALQRLVAKEEMVLDVNVRERQVNGMKTLQLETLGASAIQCFDKVRIHAVLRITSSINHEDAFADCC